MLFYLKNYACICNELFNIVSMHVATEMGNSKFLIPPHVSKSASSYDFEKGEDSPIFRAYSISVVVASFVCICCWFVLLHFINFHLEYTHEFD